MSTELIQMTLNQNGAKIAQNFIVASLRLSHSNDIFAGLYQVNHSLLDCIKVVEEALNYDDPKEYSTPEARFNYNFEEFMNGLTHLDPLDDLEQWSDNIEEFMEELCKPTQDPISEYWQWMNDVGVHAEIGLHPLEPYYSVPSFPLGLQNMATGLLGGHQL